MRKRMPDAPRSFRTPLVPFVPIAGILICLALMYSLPNESWVRLVVWMALGVAIYFIYGKKNSKLNNPE
ncbi:putative amino acid permease YhdG [compost metagenome]